MPGHIQSFVMMTHTDIHTPTHIADKLAEKKMPAYTAQVSVEDFVIHFMKALALFF